MNSKKLLCITGPTATGKTRLAALIAYELQAEIISADSRQVYRGMNLGTGKDYEDYIVNDVCIPSHLIDIADAGSEYNVYKFQQDFLESYQNITKKGKTALLCGGTGMYIESVIGGYQLMNAPEDKDFRLTLKDKSIEELQLILSLSKPLHNTTDILDRNRLIRALEISNYKGNASLIINYPQIPYVLIGILFEREFIRKRITERLQQRLKSGMIEEVKQLLKNGLTSEQLMFYGLEYSYITMYINNEIGYDEMFRMLNIAIHQFAKRQMTWFRRMEKKGFEIHWIDGQKSETEKMNEILEIYYKGNE
ncbi:MAG: tRNA (adenosine(37)-N6)-dimethylallyltransferase MiaA [Bacteroidales bacterium]